MAFVDIEKELFEKVQKVEDKTVKAAPKTILFAFKLTALTAQVIAEKLQNATMTDAKMDKLAEKQVAMESVVSNFGDLKQKNRLMTVDIHEIPEEIRSICKKHHIKVGIQQSQQDGSYTVFFHPKNQEKMQKAVNEMSRNILNKTRQKTQARVPALSLFKQLTKAVANRAKETIREKTPLRDAR